MDAATSPRSCFHCGGRLPAAAPHAVEVEGIRRPVCCAGCETAARLVLSQGLSRFYAFRTAGAPVAEGSRDWSSFDREAALRRYTHDLRDGQREISLQLEGLHCAACAWLIENSLARERGVRAIHVNAGTARAELRYDARLVPLSELLARLHALGFLPLPLSHSGDTPPETAERRAALKRLAVAGFGMMQLMTFALSLYAGVMQGMAPDLREFLRFVSLAVATPVVLYSAQPFFLSAWRSVRRGTPGMDVPVALSIAAAYLWSVWSTLRGAGTVYFDSVVMFTFFLLLGRYLEMVLRHRSGLQHDALARLLPQSVLRLDGTRCERVTPDELRAGDTVRVCAGERIAADGTIVSGVTEVDESSLTGESAPRVRARGDTLIAGTLNLGGTVEMTVQRVGQDSTLAAISRLLARARASRPPVADLADRVAAWFVCAVLLLAGAVLAYWLHEDPVRAFPATLAVLVVTCPCALSLATPVALACATTRLARAGLLVTRGRALERLAGGNRIVFDKTGTLTRGEPKLEAVVSLDERLTSARCLAVAAALERHTSHPLARAFAEVTPAGNVSEVCCTAGRGVEGRIDGVRYRIGSRAYVLESCAGVDSGAPGVPDTDCPSILLGDSAGPLTSFQVSDALRVDARETLRKLAGLGLVPLIASGDRPGAVAAVAGRLDGVATRADLSPEGKVALVHELQAGGERVVMVGDGVNDAPVLAAADVSVAIASGTDLAKVSADLVLLGEELGGLVAAVGTSRRMLRIIRQNLAWAVLYNLTAVPLAASGVLEPWMAALGMSTSSLLVVLNAMRILRFRAGPAPAVAVLSVPVARAALRT
jgi:Cu2+-exporting ATPase